MTAAIPLKGLATYADLCRVFASPRPALRHAHAASTLGSEIGGPFGQRCGGPRGWWILDEPELHLRDDILVPER